MLQNTQKVKNFDTLLEKLNEFFESFSCRDERLDFPSFSGAKTEVVTVRFLVEWKMLEK